MSKKWLIGAIGTTVMATMVLGGCRAVQDEMDGTTSSTTTTTTASSVTSTTSSSSAASTTDSTTSSTSGGLMDEITNVQ